MFAEEVSQFFEEFAVEGVIKNGPAVVRTCNGILGDPTQAVGLYDSHVEADAHFFRVAAADAAGVRKGYTLEVGGETYTVERVRRDGTGTAFLHLS